MTKPILAFEAVAKEAEGLINNGLATKAAAKLKKISLARIPRRFLPSLANSMRRSGLASLAVKALHPVVRNTTQNTASPEERAVYAASLIKIGITDEALEILEAIPPAECTDSLLYRSHALVSRWNYTESISVLVQYLSLPTLSADQIMLGRLN